MNAYGTTSEGADSVFGGTLRIGLCALFADAVLLIPPRSSRAIEPAKYTGTDFF